MLFCHTIYAAGPIEAIGLRYVSAIHIASTVFFCPSPCAPDTASPYLRPILRPAANCSTHTTPAPKAITIISGIATAGSAKMNATARHTTTTSETAHK